jgi:hypothetical protein
LFARILDFFDCSGLQANLHEENNRRNPPSGFAAVLRQGDTGSACTLCRGQQPNGGGSMLRSKLSGNRDVGWERFFTFCFGFSLISSLRDRRRAFMCALN